MNLNRRSGVPQKAQADAAFPFRVGDRNPDQEIAGRQIGRQALGMVRQHPSLQSVVQTICTCKSLRRQQSSNHRSGTAYRFSVKKEQFIQTVRLQSLRSEVPWPMSVGTNKTHVGKIDRQAFFQDSLEC
jgi:hypothetical protein